MKFETINGTLCRMVGPEPQPEPKEYPIDPIERPLRNLILEAKEKGVNIRTWYQDLIFTPESLTSYLGNGKYRWWNIGNWELTKRKANMPMPEPEPEYKVGDWVEHRESKEQARIVHIASVEYDGITIKFSYSNETEIYSTREFNIEFRKLKPSEVVLNFGSGIKGTVRSCEHDGGCVRVISGDRVIAHIMTDVLEQPTRNLVGQLLKAQEGEK